MKWLSTITLDLQLDEIIQILDAVCKHPGIVMIDQNITINGPEIIDIERVRRSFYEKDISKRAFGLWNTNINLPLCWELFLLNYSEKCEPITKKSSLSANSRNDDEKQKIIEFRKLEINDLFFHSGQISNSLSPIIEFDMPYENKQGYFELTAKWEQFMSGMWILWDMEGKHWVHEYRQELIDVMFGENEYRKPDIFINWQEEVMEAIKSDWGKYIIERHTYEMGDETDEEVINDVAQRLADLLNEKVAGREPRPPIISKRNNKNA